MRTRSLLLTAFAALGCATARPTANTSPTAPASTTTPAKATLTPGLAADEVRRRLGEPRRVEHVTSAAAPGTVYERWRYPDREVVLLDGKVIDVVP